MAYFSLSVSLPTQVPCIPLAHSSKPSSSSQIEIEARMDFETPSTTSPSPFPFLPHPGGDGDPPGLRGDTSPKGAVCQRDWVDGGSLVPLHGAHVSVDDDGVKACECGWAAP